MDLFKRDRIDYCHSSSECNQVFESEQTRTENINSRQLH
jgi:hypothetical protein